MLLLELYDLEMQNASPKIVPFKLLMLATYVQLV